MLIHWKSGIELMSNQSLNQDKKDGASEQESVHNSPVLAPSIGINKIEALHSTAKSSSSRKRILCVIGIGVGITSFAYAIQVSTRCAVLTRRTLRAS